MSAVVVLKCQPNLPEVVLTRSTAGRFAGHLHGRKQQRHEDPNNGNDHEKFDESKAARGSTTRIHDLPSLSQPE
jgi:hypothetical protein